MYNKDKIEKELRELLENDSDVLAECVNEINNYYGTFSDEEYIPMEDLDIFMENKSPSDILMRAFFGYDEDTDGAFNPNRNYFKFNGYGNLVSTDYIDYSDLIDDVIDKIMDELDGNFIPCDAAEIIEKYTYDNELELENEEDMKLLYPDINDYDVFIDGDTIYCKDENFEEIENLLIESEIEYC